MKILENYCSQPRNYADAEGWLKIQLEANDNREEIIRQYHSPKQNWYDESCEYCPTLSNESILVFKRHQVFLD